MTNVVPFRAAGGFGATPADWLHFDLVLGLGPDLLPVVSNPTAKISEQSTLKGIGKTPSVFNGRREVVGIKAWTKYRSTDDDLVRWAAEPDYSICVQTREVRALDVDVDDAELAAAIADHFMLELGLELPARTRANSGKLLLAFRLPGDMPKRSFKVEGGLVEFLASGQQFVAVGTHTSGSPYVWAKGLPFDIVVVTPEAFERAWASIIATFALEGSLEGGAGSDRTRADLEGVTDEVADYLEAEGLVLGSQAEKLFVECPWKDGHSGDSGISETAWLIAGTRGFERGHFECRHATCMGRKDEDFLDAIGYRISGFTDLDADDAEGASSPSVSQEHLPWPKFKRNKAGQIEPTLDNVTLALARPDIVGVTVRFDTFRDELLADGAPFSDADAVQVRVVLEQRGFKPVGKEIMRDALALHARDNQFDSAKDWLAALPEWDGKERCASTFPRLFMTEDTPYTRAVGLYTWTALAARILDPGCKVDMAIALQGTQGLLKSTGVKMMAPSEEMFREIGLHKIDADLSRKLRGCIVGELAELRGLRTRDAETIRAWMVQQHERWVPKFMEREITFPRRCVLFATVNAAGFLDDEEGERRWLPMTVTGRVNVELIEAERLQLWAEGVLRYEMGGIAWAEAERLAQPEHAKYKVHDVWSDLVQKWFDEPLHVDGTTARMQGYFSLTQVAAGAVGLEASRMGRPEQVRLGRVLRTLGLKNQTIRVDGSPLWAWVWDRKGE